MAGKCHFNKFASGRIVSAIAFGTIVILSAGPLAAVDSADSSLIDSSVTFREVEGVIPLEDRSRRKWDHPLVADLDQDGLLDLLLTDHSYRARLYWNDNGTFSQPVDVVQGDTHGVAAGDYDQDGRIDLIVSRGGGDGKNPRNPVTFQVNRDRTIEGGEEFAHFERSRGRAVKFIDGDNNGTLDLVLSAFPLKTQTQGANDLFKNTGPGEFEFVTKLPVAKWMGFRTLVTDFNNDDDSDLIFYGGDNMVAVRGETGLAYSDATAEVLPNLENTSFVSSIAEIDYDNDGDYDLFLTRADHPFERKTHYDKEHSRFAFFMRFKEFLFEDLEIEGDFIFENLQMAFPHFDVFVGANKRKLEFAVDRHGHKDFTLKPEESEGWPSDLSDKGLYIGYLGNDLWRIKVDTKSPTAGVIHNVKSHPQVTQPKQLPAQLWENRDGFFVDVTSRLGISIAEQTTSAVAGDFDNNGWSDLFVVRQGNPASQNQQILYLNQNGKYFQRTQQHGIVSQELGSTGGGAEAFDYDGDGDLDLIYCNERGRWHLFTNQSSFSEGSNYVVIRVGKSPSNEAPMQGAMLTLEADGKIYRRTVGASSAAYSHSANNHLHVGLGNCETIDSAIVRWTNGETESLQINTINKSFSAGQFE